MIRESLNERRYKGERLVPYLGIDATGPSLHVGHLIPLLAIREFEAPYILVGTETAKIGDPTGKTEQRSKLSDETVSANRANIVAQVKNLIPSAVIVKNAQFSLDEVSDFISINRLVKYEIFKNRMSDKDNLSLSEFLYPIRQAYDFLALHREYGVNLQIGGSDQYTNILAGIDLIRNMDKADVFGKTTHILSAKSGRKISKTEGGAVYLNDDAFNIWQFFRNIRDEDISVFGHEIPEEVKDINAKKIEIATTMTTWCCGKEEAKECADKARELYSSKTPE